MYDITPYFPHNLLLRPFDPWGSFETTSGGLPLFRCVTVVALCLVYVIAEDYPNIRLVFLLHSDRNPFLCLPLDRIGPTRRLFYAQRRCHFRTISTDRGPSQLGLHLQALRTIGLSPRQLDNMAAVTTSQTCHFGVPVAAHSTVSWSQVRVLGPLIDHARQTTGPGSLDLPIYNLVAQNEGGPDLVHWTLNRLQVSLVGIAQLRSSFFCL